jgi:hypothetical protein
VLADPQTRALAVDGQEGVWFPKEKAKKLLLDVEQLPGLHERLRLATEKNVLLKEKAEITTEVAETWKKAAEDQAKLLPSGALLERPAFWLVLGLLGGMAASIAIFATTQEMR